MRMLLVCGLMLFGVMLTADEGRADTRYRNWKITDFDLRLAEKTALPEDESDGLTALLKEIRSGLALQGSRKLLGWDRPRFNQSLLAADRRRIVLHLARNGFPGARVEPVFATEVDERRLRLTLSVHPGAAVRVAGIEMINLPLAEGEQDSVGIHVRGTLFSERLMQGIGAQLTELARSRGYAKIEVRASAVPLDSTRVILLYEFESGSRYTFTSAVVSGVRDDLRDLAAKRLAFIHGREYAPELLTRAQMDLRDLQLFRQINLDTRPVGGDSLLLVASLTGRKQQHTAVSVGTWSDHYCRVKASWRHRNLFRRGRGFLIRGAWSPQQSDAATGVWWPGLPRPDARLSLTMGFEAEREESYHQDTGTLELGLLLRPWRQWREQWRFGLGLSWVWVDDRTPGEDNFDAGAGRLLTLSLDLRQDRSDDPLEPRNGFRLHLGGEYSPTALLSDSPYVSTTGQITAYRPLGPVTLACRLHGATAIPLGDSSGLLPGVRLFAGGGSSMRGYHRRELGPLDGSDDPLGGRIRILMGAELRLPLPGPFGLALFVDAGQVWADNKEMRDIDLAAAIGPGLTISTPIGAIRGDFAFNRLSADDDDGGRARPDDWVFHFSIGHPW